MTTIDPSEFRRLLGHFVTGVTIVAACDPDAREPHGLTLNALCSASLEPPLVLVCIDRSSVTHGLIEVARAFSVNILADTQERLSRRFAAPELAEKFSGVAWHEEITGAPVLEDALAWLDCALRASYPVGDHTIFIGEVVAGDAREGGPLVYYRGGYGRYLP